MEMLIPTKSRSFNKGNMPKMVVRNAMDTGRSLLTDESRIAWQGFPFSCRVSPIKVFSICRHQRSAVATIIRSAESPWKPIN